MCSNICNAHRKMGETFIRIYNARHATHQNARRSALRRTLLWRGTKGRGWRRRWRGRWVCVRGERRWRRKKRNRRGCRTTPNAPFADERGGLDQPTLHDVARGTNVDVSKISNSGISMRTTQSAREWNPTSIQD